MDSLLSYDDSEDRALTTYCLMNWKSVYLSTAIAYTEAPTNFKSLYKAATKMEKRIS